MSTAAPTQRKLLYVTVDTADQEQAKFTNEVLEMRTPAKGWTKISISEIAMVLADPANILRYHTVMDRYRATEAWENEDDIEPEEYPGIVYIYARNVLRVAEVFE